MATEFGSIHTNGCGFNLPQKIDDSLKPTNEREESEREFDFDQHYPNQPPSAPPPQMFQPFQFSPSMNEQPKLLGDGDNKMYFIILFIAFILGFFMGKTMQPIIIRST
jgi:hypothetical protein